MKTETLLLVVALVVVAAFAWYQYQAAEAAKRARQQSLGGSIAGIINAFGSGIGGIVDVATSSGGSAQ